MSRRLSKKPLSERTRARARAHRQVLAPPPVGNTRAVTHGAAADGANLPGFEITRAEVQAAVDVATWLQPSDLLVVDVFTRELHAYRYTGEALANLSNTAYLKKTNAWKLQIRRARTLGELADRIGFTAVARARLGLTSARIQREMQRVTPERSEERARRVAEILAQAKALPPTDEEHEQTPPADPVADDAPPAPVVPLRGSEAS